MNYKSILKTVGIAVLASFLCVGCGDKGTGGGGEEEPASTYTITFDPNGGERRPSSDKTKADGTLSSWLGEPTRKGYTFNGWFTEVTGGELVTQSTVFNKNTTIYARWTFNITKVTFDANGGTVTPDTGTIVDGWKLTSLPTPTRDGYIFNGWFSAATGGTAVTEDSVLFEATTAYAQWTFKPSKITFDANGGTVTPDTATTGYDWKLATLPTPTRTGYTFNGWFTATTGGTAVTKDTAFSKDTTIYAQWGFIPYKVRFLATGGTVTPDTGMTGDGWKLAFLPTPTRDGYTFNGWFIATVDGNTIKAEGGEAVTDSTVFSQNTYIYARWTPHVYTVTFDSRGGTDVDSQDIEYGSKVSRPTDPTRINYMFNTWYKDTAYTTQWNFYFDGVTSATTLYAKWILIQYTIAFNSQGGSTVTSQNVEPDNKVTKPADPTRTGYTFGGWYKEDTYTTLWNFDTDTVTSYMTLYAKWNIIQYTITFDANDGTVTPTNATTGAGCKLASLPTPTKSGYFFNGWFTEETGGTKVTTSTEFSADATIYAQWIITYTIMFDANDGEVSPASGTTGEGGKLTFLPTPTRDGYFFEGWFTEEMGGTKVTTSTVFSANATIYAKWTPIYTITFDANDGEVSPASGTTGEGGKLTSLPIPTRGIYTFTGWYTAATGGAAVTTSTVFSENTTVYARWIERLTDSRDGRTYKWVKINTQTWMAENLSYDVPNETNVCFNEYCAEYGRMYSWSAARKACPVGWHLPSDAEWTTLTNYVGATTAGTQLKSSTYWNTYSNVPTGTNDYGFSALPGGYATYTVGTSALYLLKSYGYWWSATQYDADNAWYRSMRDEDEDVSRGYSSKIMRLYSVRCVQD